jgi:hypothetical protein
MRGIFDAACGAESPAYSNKWERSYFIKMSLRIFDAPAPFAARAK